MIRASRLVAGGPHTPIPTRPESQYENRHFSSSDANLLSLGYKPVRYMPPTHSNSRPGETTSCRESLHILNAVEVHGPGCTRGFHPEHDKGSLSDQHNVTVPQQQRPDNDPRVSGHSRRSDHPRQDADSLPSSYRPVGLASDIAVPVNTGNAASIESFSKIPHTKSCRRRSRFPPTIFGSVDNPGRGTHAACGKLPRDPSACYRGWL